MKVVAALQADLDTTPLGTRSRLAQELVGVPVLRRTVMRLQRTRDLRDVYVLCPPAQQERCQALLQGTGAKVRAVEAPVAPWSSLVQTARKWALDGWRGGLGGTTCFDEYTDCRVLDGLLETVQADAVLSVAPAAVLIDPALADRMIEHNRNGTELTDFTFTQAPPGLAGILLRKRMIHEFASKNVPIGWTFAYQPQEPRKDMIFLPCCCEIPPAVRYAVGRCIADTQRCFQRLERLLREQEDPDAESVGTWLQKDEATQIEAGPREVEIELTTEDPYPDAVLRPRGSRVPARGPLDVDLVRKVVDELACFDDSLLVLGGFGDPLCHPHFVELLSALGGDATGASRPYGLAVRTTAANLDDATMEAMVVHGVDVLNVVLDAWSAELYGRLQSPHDPSAAPLDVVLSRLDRLAEISRSHGSSRPILLPEMTKARDNVQELDDFHDGWLRRIGAVVIRGHSHHARQFDDRGVIPMAPAARTACRRIRSRAFFLADGRMTLCDQDFQGRHAFGHIGEQTLHELWHSHALEKVRRAHRDGRFEATPLCSACEEWHRP